MANLNNHIVVVTGSTGGIGNALVASSIKRGANVVAIGRSDNKLEELLSKFNTEKLTTLKIDLMNENYEAISEKLKNRLNEMLLVNDELKVSILINNAGVSSRSSVQSTNMDVYEKLMKINLFSGISLTKTIIPFFKEKSNSCYLINISSLQGYLPLPYRSGYSMTKFAMQSFGDCLRSELYGDDKTSHIHVVTVSPSYVQTKISVNALKGNGDTFQREENHIYDTGDTPEYIAECTFNAISGKGKPKSDVLFGGIVHRLAVWLKFISPWFYTIIMSRRARNQKTVYS
ncbi:hypothetical protein SNEBB_010761 [Seison nebaliae]|nr:hypothetical protein SNEBB_010761 [Seison nebaliae]